MERRELFSSLFPSKKEGKETLIRPPYYKDETSFYKECVNCIDKQCITFCQENIIVLDENETPILDFSKGGCTYCDECAKACPSDVLNLEDKSLIEATFEIEMLQCLSWNNTMCFSCKDPCLDNAIEFLGMFRPSINMENCTNCGFCVSVCPTNAIKIRSRS